ncbi:MAG: hypothetical protein HZB92_09080 [Euryarchaeota archaeon]|nr:hypothetical protein [Euryarchaeota archaeon]
MKVVRLGRSESKSRAKVTVAGCGGAGCNVIDSAGMDHAIRTMALNSDSARLGSVRADLKLHLPASEAMKIMTSDRRVAIGQHVPHAERLREGISGANFVNVITGLGGRTGWRLAAALGRVCGESGVPVLCTAIVPFGTEGTCRSQEASEQARTLRRECDGLLLIRNDRLTAIAPRMTFVQALGVAARLATILPIEISSLVPEGDIPHLTEVLRVAGHLEVEAVEARVDEEIHGMLRNLSSSKWLSMDPAQVVSALAILRTPALPDKLESDAAHALRILSPKMKCLATLALNCEGKNSGMLALLGFESQLSE